MEKSLRESLCSYKVVRINHFGSTAINSIWAKPIINILLEITSGKDMHIVSAVITNGGFIKMSKSNNSNNIDEYAVNVFRNSELPEPIVDEFRVRKNTP